jgi:hypothetical protein
MDSLVKLAGSELLAERKDFGGDAFCPISFVGYGRERSQFPPRARSEEDSHSQVATSSILGTVAESAMNLVFVPNVFIRLTTTSRTAPRTSIPTKWISSILHPRQLHLRHQNDRTHQKSLNLSIIFSFPLHRRVTTSHFSGVVTTILASPISLRDPRDVVSPVSSTTSQPSGANLDFQSEVRSEQRDLVGAM